MDLWKLASIEIKVDPGEIIWRDSIVGRKYVRFFQYLVKLGRQPLRAIVVSEIGRFKLAPCHNAKSRQWTNAKHLSIPSQNDNQIWLGLVNPE